MRLLDEMPYAEDSSALFDAIAHRSWAVFLDSGRPGDTLGRYDLLACDPMATLVTRGGQTEIRDREGTRFSDQDPFRLLQDALQPGVEPHPDIPFTGGAVGYFAYDLARRLERLPSLAEDAEQLPEMAVGIFDWALVVDHHARRSWLVGQGRDPSTASRWEGLVGMFRTVPAQRRGDRFAALGPVRSNLSFAEYGERFERIQRYIRDGDTYQVNFAQRFAVPAAGDPWLGYRELRRLNPAPYGAYFRNPYAHVLSSSPERFVRVQGDRVQTRPIKGTCARDPDPGRDRAQAAALCDSEKNRAENLMIVDLLRNDLGKSCRPGSIEVPELFRLESFATVHHLVSTVRGTLAPGATALTLLRGCFPGGSVTGAPKLRAMEIIEELEPHRRGIYCGAIGYAGFDGGMDSSIAIRTLVWSRGQARFWAGGGVVADSSLREEYQETLDKAAAMFRLFGQPEGPRARD